MTIDRFVPVKVVLASPGPKTKTVPCMTQGCTGTIELDRPSLFDSDGKWITQLHNPIRLYFCEPCRSGANRWLNDD